jgi:pyruvate/2-oxoglutarate dehydrogenase complex dihydrolipoamide acyltransferase (E2) component
VKLGSNNRKVVIGVSALFALALVMFARMIWVSAGSTSAAPPIASTATSPAAANKSAAATQHRGHLKTSDKKNGKTAGPPTPSLDPRLRLEQLELAENTEYAGTGRNIFQDQAEPVIPKPVEGAFKQKPQVNTPPPAPVIPPPPPINLRYFGFANNSGSPVRKAFLSNGDDVFVAAEGEIVNRRYKILRINPTSIEIQDVLSNNTQSIPLSQG